jgi:hypothetical protein
LALVACGIAGGEPPDFVVAPNGSDRNPGSVAQPFASLGRARVGVREILRRGPARDLTVLVREGTYTLTEPLVFDADDCHTGDHRVTYAAWPGEAPLFSGGRTLTNWTPAEGNRWTTQIPDVAAGQWFFDQLFVDGLRSTRARHPNAGFFRVESAGPDERTSFGFRSGDLLPRHSLDGAELVFLHDWSISRVAIGRVDHDHGNVTLAHPIGADAPFFRIAGFEPHPRYYVEDALDLVDAPGEWHLDRRKGVLTYQAGPNDNLSAATVVAPLLDRLLVVRGDARADRPARNLRFVGLTFAYAAAPRFPGGYAGIQAGFHQRRSPAGLATGQARMPAAVVFQSASGCSLERCRVLHVGGTAVSFEGQCLGNQVLGSEIADAGGNGTMIGEPSAESQNAAADNVVVNNRIHDCGKLFYGCVGVWVGITRGTTVAHNEIYDLPYSGVSVGWVWNPTPSPCRDNRIQFNHIHHVMQVLSDGGGVYTLGRQPGTVLRANLVHDVPANAGRAESNGFFIDEGSSELLIENNIIYGVARSPIRFHRASGNVVRKNVLVAPPGTPTFRFNSTDEKSITFEDNQTPFPDRWVSPTPQALGAGINASSSER